MDWMSNNYIELFGAITGIVYVILEIKQRIWLWPVGILTSAVYIWIFFMSKIYADMSLQVYYLAISILGWYWWAKGAGHRAQGTGQKEDGSGRRAQGTGQKEDGSGRRAEGAGQKKEGEIEERSDEIPQSGKGRSERSEDSAIAEMDETEKTELQVTRLKLKTGVILVIVFMALYITLWLVLTRLTDSPVPVRDSFITSLSIIATWMLARKIYEHWYLWIVVNFVSAVLFFTRGLYPTVILYLVYGIMSFAGLVAWKKTIRYSDI